MKTKVYKKLFITYSIIIIVSLSILSTFFISNVYGDDKKQRTEKNQNLLEDTNFYINNQINQTKVLMNMLYTSNDELDDTIYFLKYDIEDYNKFKLDNLLKSERLNYRSIFWFAKTCYAYESNIDNICFYSFQNGYVYVFNKQGYLNSFKLTKTKETIQNSEDVLKEIIKKLNNDSGSQSFFTVNNITSPYNLEKVGLFIVGYSTDEINNIYKRYKIDNGNLIVIGKDGKVIYDSLGKNIGNKYIYYDKLKPDRISAELGNMNYANYLYNTSDVCIACVFSGKVILKNMILEIGTILGIVLILLIVGESIVYSRLMNLEERTFNIVNAMNEVKKGNFNFLIEEVGKEDDEINFISENFNNMCITLDGYIKKEYLGQIKQKKAEMKALQNQINPHFLYNTLESIRMKASIDGNKEVSKMLYNLSSLFRSVVKDKNIITIKEELEYCKRYLDLYKFRFNDKFNYSIECNDKLMNKQIIKFIIQPIVENFLTHGINLERDDNFLSVLINEEGNDLIINIKDNGKGINTEKLQSINDSIKNEFIDNESIGLINVNERIVLQYGEGYGINIINRENGGIKVAMRIPNKEVEIDD